MSPGESNNKYAMSPKIEEKDVYSSNGRKKHMIKYKA